MFKVFGRPNGIADGENLALPPTPFSDLIWDFIYTPDSLPRMYDNEIKHDVLSRPGRYRKIKENLHAKEVTVGGSGVLRRRYLVCYNAHEANRQRQHRAKVVTQLKTELARHQNHKATAQWAIELLASPRTKRCLTITKTGEST